MVDQVIVRRTFKVDGRDAECRFLRPEEDGGSFFCRYEIDWPEGVKGHRAGGVDQVQALLLAMMGAHANLLERFSSELNRLGFTRRRFSDSRSLLAKEVGMDGPSFIA